MSQLIVNQLNVLRSLPLFLFLSLPLPSVCVICLFIIYTYDL